MNLSAGSSDDAIGVRLEQAKATYQSTIARQKAAVLSAFDKAAEVARTAGKMGIVDQIKVEREQFEKDGTPISVIPMAAYEKSIKQAQTALESQYDVAIKEYTRANQNEKAASALKELQDLLGLRVDLNGKTIAIGNALYWIDRGYRRHIETNEVRLSLFLAADRWESVPDGRLIPEGEKVTSANRLIKGSADEIFLVDGGKKRSLTTLKIARQNHFDLSKAAQVSDSKLSQIPNGEPIK